MQIRYYKEYSRYLDRDMEFKAYGHAGRPIIIFPCQSGRFYDWEDRHMCDLASPWIDSGKLQIFTADSIDPESWDNHGPERPRIEMQERWYNYVCEELTPRILQINREQGEDHTGRVLVGGASMGAGHAVNFYLRRPDLYNGTLRSAVCILPGCSSAIIWMTWYIAILPAITCATSRKITLTKSSTHRPINSSCAADREPGKTICWLPPKNCSLFWRARTSIPLWISGEPMSPMTGPGGKSSGRTFCR